MNGAISEFTITEATVSNVLPPTDGTVANNAMGPNTFNPYLHPLQAFGTGRGVSGDGQRSGQHAAVLGCAGMVGEPERGFGGEHRSRGCACSVERGQRLVLAGDLVVEQGADGVVDHRADVSARGTDTAPTPDVVWPSIARADGPVYAWVWWMNGSIDQDTGEVTPPPADCPSVVGIAENPAYTLGYVQLTTISELAPAIFGQDSEATAAQAVNHQFDYAKGDCVSNTIGPDFFFGSSIFLARSDFYADGLGAAYAAGTVNSGVLLTPPTVLDQRTKDTIRLQGVSTVFITGGPLAISEGIEKQLDNTIAFQCGGTQPRIDILTGLPQTLNVVRLGGVNQYDTNQLLAEFVGAEPPAVFGAFAATTEFNSTAGTSTVGVACWRSGEHRVVGDR